MIVPGLTLVQFEKSKKKLVKAYAKILSIPEALVEMTLKKISRLKRAIVDDPKYGIILSNVVAQNESSMKRIDVAINEHSFVSKLNNEMNGTEIMIEAIANITIRNQTQTGNRVFFQIKHVLTILLKDNQTFFNNI